MYTQMADDQGKTTYLTTPRKEALNKVSGHVGTGKKLLETPVSNLDELRDIKARYRKWREYGAQLLKNMFSDNSLADQLKNNTGIVYTGPDFDGRYKQFRDDFSKDITTLESIEETLPIMPLKPRYTPPKREQQKASPSVTQHFHGPVNNAIGVNSGHAHQKSRQTGSSADGKLWQLFLALLSIAGAAAVAYIAYRMHWV